METLYHSTHRIRKLIKFIKVSMLHVAAYPVLCRYTSRITDFVGICGKAVIMFLKNQLTTQHQNKSIIHCSSIFVIVK